MAMHIYPIAMLLLLISCGKRGGHSEHEGHDTPQVDENVGKVTLPANHVVLSLQKTVKPTPRNEGTKVTATGYIAFDERRNRKISLRIPGRIEKLHIRYDYQFVRQGQAIAELYSPELRTYQAEYLFLLNAGEDNLLQKSKEKLRLLGLADYQIRQFEKKGDVTETITITSPVEGFIRFSSGAASSGGMKEPTSSMDEMSGISTRDNAAPLTSAGQIREGVYVNTGQTLFIVNDIKKVLAILSADNPSQIGFKKGTPVKLYSEVQSEPIIAKIDLVEPLYENNQRFTQVRVYLDNPDRRLKINSLIRGEFSIEDQSVSIPASSVYDLGTRKIVWVKTGVTSNGIGMFEARVVSTGMTSKGQVAIMDGLESDEEIALDAGYMLDSESILNEKQ